MSKTSSALPRLTPEQRLAAAGQYERANQVLATGNLDYAMQLLLNCCVIDPGNPTYRQALRQAQKSKHQNNQKGASLSFLTTLKSKAYVKSALRSGNFIKVLEYGEHVLMKNPWDVGTHLAMATAFENLEANGMAMWMLDQVRQVDGTNPKINRPLARLFEKAGKFTSAMALWELVRKADPSDLEAQHKYKDLAASATIAKGKYEEAVEGTAKTPLMSPLNETAAGAVAGTVPDMPAAKSVPPGKSIFSSTGKPHGGKTDPAIALPNTPELADSANPDTPSEGKAPREVAALQAKIAANPTNPNAYLHLAAIYRRADQFDRARKVLHSGLAPTANNFDIGMELLDLEIEPFRQDLAVTVEMINTQPENPELQGIRARLAKEVATRELHYFRLKSERFPTEAGHRFEMGLRLYQCGQIDEAIRELQGIRTDPRHQGKALVYLGFCFRARNNWRLAQRNFEEALNHLSPGDDGLRKELYYQLAKGYADSGDYNRAMDLACELANLDFSYKDIGKLLDDWNAKMQKA